jgi:hypothetical protein
MQFDVNGVAAVNLLVCWSNQKQDGGLQIAQPQLCQLSTPIAAEVVPEIYISFNMFEQAAKHDICSNIEPLL